MANRNNPAKWFCFTLNNPADGWDVRIRSAFAEEIVTFACWQLEISPTTSTPHIQGCLYFKNKKRALQVARDFVVGAHVEVCRGTPQDNIAYCTKADTRAPGTEPVVLGDASGKGQGRRNDLKAVKALIDSGRPMLEVAEQHFETFVRNHVGLTKYAYLRAPQRRELTECIILVGPPGSGKSTAVYETHPDAYLLNPPSNGSLWWDGYMPGVHDVVWIDDMRDTWVSPEYLFQLINPTPMRVNSKGDKLIPFTSRRVVITTNQELSDWWSFKSAAEGFDRAAFTRRCHCVLNYKLLEDGGSFRPHPDNPKIPLPVGSCVPEHARRRFGPAQATQD